MDSISVKAAAKINLYLKVTGIRADGYHNLDTLMSSVDIFDDVTVTKRNDETINCYIGNKTCGVNNTAYKAAEIISTSFKTKGVDIIIKKGIPFSAGLGGSSADAAAVFYAMNILYQIGPLKDLESLALKIGSDVPFMMIGGLARILGIGEKIEKISHSFNYKILILKQKSGLSTKAVYNQYDKMAINKSDNKEVDIKNINTFINDLQSAAVELCPEIKESIKQLEKLGAIKAMMTGSGSAVFGLFDNNEVLAAAYRQLRNGQHYCRTANFISGGIRIKNI